jgi:imidazolonepropionase
MADLLITKARILTCASKYPKRYDELADLSVTSNGYVAVADGIIIDVGSGEGNEHIHKHTVLLDAGGKTVMPGLVDPHTHAVHYGSREHELELKLKGVPYLEILKQGGGILNTVNATRNANRDDLSSKLRKTLNTMLLWGTTTVEIKSGYGLNFADEVKCLEVVRDLDHPMDLIATYMGAHAVPPEFKDNRQGYIDLMIQEVIPYVAKHNLAEFIDCFCEHGVFSVEESEQILLHGQSYGLDIKIHADEIEPMGGGELAARIGAITAEHLVAVSPEGIAQMRTAGTIPILLPGTSFYLKLKNYAPARQMIENGLPIALASDYNPGSCPTESIQSVMIHACLGMGLTPAEIINGMTINAAFAIKRGDQVGSIEKGKQADILIMDAPNEQYLIYHFGINHVDTVIKKGQVLVQNGKHV